MGAVMADNGGSFCLTGLLGPAPSAAVGALLGLAVAPTLVYYASADPQALWQSGGATALSGRD